MQIFMDVSRRSMLHINNLELLAVFLALKAFLSQIQGESVIVMVVGQIANHGGTRHCSTSLFQLTRELLLWYDRLGIVLKARHIPGHLGVFADQVNKTTHSGQNLEDVEPSHVTSLHHTQKRITALVRPTTSRQSVGLHFSDLSVLVQGPFEPSGSASLKFLSMNVAF